MNYAFQFPQRPEDLQRIRDRRVAVGEQGNGDKASALSGSCSPTLFNRVPPDTYYGYEPLFGQRVKMRSGDRMSRPPEPPSLGWVVFWLVVCAPVAVLVLYVREQRKHMLREYNKNKGLREQNCGCGDSADNQ